MKFGVRQFAIAATLALLGAAGTACAEHQVGGKAAKDVFSDPALMSLADAACRGDSEEVSTLAKQGADPNGLGFQGVTPLYWAITCENVAGMRALLKAGADPNLLFGGRFSATYQASTYRNPELLRLLLEFGGDPDSFSRQTDDTALMKALSIGIQKGDWRNWELLIRSGADINKSNEVYNTVAVNAVFRGQFGKVVELLDLGYTCDLPRLGRLIEQEEGMTGPTSGTEAAKAALRKRGVSFPIGSDRGSPADKAGCHLY